MSQTFPTPDPMVAEARELAAELRTKMLQVRPTRRTATSYERLTGRVQEERPVFTTTSSLSAAQLSWLSEYAAAEKRLHRETREAERAARRAARGQ